MGPGVVGVSLSQDAAEAVAAGVHGLVLPAGHLRERDELPNEGPCCRLRQQEVVGPRNLFIAYKKDSVSLDMPFIQTQPQGLTPNTRP